MDFPLNLHYNTNESIRVLKTFNNIFQIYTLKYTYFVNYSRNLPTLVIKQQYWVNQNYPTMVANRILRRFLRRALVAIFSKSLNGKSWAFFEKKLQMRRIF